MQFIGIDCLICLEEQTYCFVAVHLFLAANAVTHTFILLCHILHFAGFHTLTMNLEHVVGTATVYQFSVLIEITEVTSAQHPLSLPEGVVEETLCRQFRQVPVTLCYAV